MNGREWIELVEWMVPRWTQIAAWSDPELQAMFDDLEPYAAADIRAMLDRLWRQGREYPPRASTVLAMLREYRTVPERALPARDPDGPRYTVTLGDYLATQGHGSVRDLITQLRKEHENESDHL